MFLPKIRAPIRLARCAMRGFFENPVPSQYEPLPEVEERSQLILFLKKIYDMRHPKSYFAEETDKILAELRSKSAAYSQNTDQIKEVQGKISNLYEYIKENILNTQLESLNLTAQHYFSAQGKLFRPIMNILISKTLFEKDNQPSSDYYSSEIFIKQKNWAAVIEILHIASLVHDDIIDNSKTRRGLVTVHEKFGKQSAVYAGNYLIGRAGRKIANFNDPSMFEVYSMIMDNLTAGEYIQARKNRDFSSMPQLLIDYMSKSHYKTASLMAHSCRGVALMQNAEEDYYQAICFKIGQHLGVAFQLIDDVLDFTVSSEDLGKTSLNDVKEGHLNGPVLFAVHEAALLQQEEVYNEMTLKLARKAIDPRDLSRINSFVKESSGIERTVYLASLHAKKAVELAEEITKGEKCKAVGGLVELAIKSITRKK